MSHAPSAPPIHAAVRELFGETADCKYIHTMLTPAANGLHQYPAVTVPTSKLLRLRLGHQLMSSSPHRDAVESHLEGTMGQQVRTCHHRPTTRGQGGVGAMLLVKAIKAVAAMQHQPAVAMKAVS